MPIVYPTEAVKLAEELFGESSEITTAVQSGQKRARSLLNKEIKALEAEIDLYWLVRTWKGVNSERRIERQVKRAEKLIRLNELVQSASTERA